MRSNSKPETGDCQICPLYKGTNWTGIKHPIPDEEGVCIRIEGLCESKTRNGADHV
jgi:hypothetical protein